MAKTIKKLEKYYEGLGRRKEAVARVRLTPDQKPSFVINGRTVEQYFPTEELQLVARRVLSEMAPAEKFTVSVKLLGGGIHAQAEALAHGLARALLKFNPEHKVVLRQKRYLTRDARTKERRKFGLKKARKAPQWSKR